MKNIDCLHLCSLASYASWIEVIHTCLGPSFRRYACNLKAVETGRLLLALYQKRYLLSGRNCHSSCTRYRCTPWRTSNHGTCAGMVEFYRKVRRRWACHTAHHIPCCTCNGGTPRNTSHDKERTDLHKVLGMRCVRNGFHISLCKDSTAFCRTLYIHVSKLEDDHTSACNLCELYPCDTLHTYQDTCDHIPARLHKGLRNLLEWPSRRLWLHVRMASRFS